MEGVQGTSQNVWHDDGTADGKAQEHPMYKRDKTDDVSTFKDLPVAEATQVINFHWFIVWMCQLVTVSLRTQDVSAGHSLA